MINLLPPEIKEELRLQKETRLFLVLGITLVVPLICFILVLCSVTLYLLAEVNTKQLVLAQTQEQYQTADFLHFKEVIQKYNKSLVFLDSFYKKEVYATQALTTIASMDYPQNLYLTDLSLNRNQDQTIKASVMGFAQSRDDLLAFQKSIETITAIKNPVFSPESWVRAQNVTFYLTFEVAPSTLSN